MYMWCLWNKKELLIILNLHYLLSPSSPSLNAPLPLKDTFVPGYTTFFPCH